MKRKIQKAGARGYKISIPTAFLERLGLGYGNMLDTIMGKELRYTPYGRIAFPHNTYELTKVPYGAGAYLSIPKQWLDFHGLYSGCEIEVEDKDGDIIIRNVQ